MHFCAQFVTHQIDWSPIKRSDMTIHKNSRDEFAHAVVAVTMTPAHVTKLATEHEKTEYDSVVHNS